MHHIGVAEDDVRLATDCATRVRRRIAVVGEDADLWRLARAAAASPLQQLRKAVKLGQLILRERLGWKQVKRACRGILQDRVENRRVVAASCLRPSA